VIYRDVRFEPPVTRTRTARNNFYQGGGGGELISVCERVGARFILRIKIATALLRFACILSRENTHERMNTIRTSVGIPEQTESKHAARRYAISSLLHRHPSIRSHYHYVSNEGLASIRGIVASTFQQRFKHPTRIRGPTTAASGLFARLRGARAAGVNEYLKSRLLITAEMSQADTASVGTLHTDREIVPKDPRVHFRTKGVERPSTMANIMRGEARTRARLKS